MTTVKNTGFPIQEVEQPAIVICGQGQNALATQVAYFQAVLDHAGITTFTGADFVLKFDSEEVYEARKDLLINKSQAFIEQYFPNNFESNTPLEAVEKVLKLLEPMFAKNPEAWVKAEVAAQGGFDPCSAEGNHFIGLKLTLVHFTCFSHCLVQSINITFRIDGT